VSDVDGLLRLLNVGFRRYAREPETRAESSRLILNAAVALHAAHTSPAEAALAAAEALGPVAASARQRRAG
jgi:hypothetical protein